MVYSLEDIKMDIVKILREDLNAENTSGTIQVDLNKDTLREVAQSIYTFSTVYRETSWNSFPVEIMIKKTGSPSGSVVLDFCSSKDDLPANTILSSTLPPGSIPTSFSTRSTFWLDLSSLSNKYLGSYTKYFLKIRQTGSVDPSNYYSVARSSVDTGYLWGTAYTSNDGTTWNTLASDLNFRCSFPTWIYPDYPHERLDIYRFPRIAVDIVGRPRIFERWISAKIAQYELRILLVFYSREADELDALMSYTDRVLFKERTKISSLRILTPSNFTPATVVRPGLLARSALYTGIFHMIADS